MLNTIIPAIPLSFTSIVNTNAGYSLSMRLYKFTAMHFQVAKTYLIKPERELKWLSMRRCNGGIGSVGFSRIDMNYHRVQFSIH